MVNFICTENEIEAGKRAAEIMAEVIKNKANATLGLATGSTPINMYGELVKMYKRGEISFAKVKSVNLDEYVGLSGEHNQSYAFFMRRHLFSLIDIKEENTHIPNGISIDSSEECRRYDNLLDSLGDVDIQLLGIGHNGHIAFNEPNSHFPKDTSVVELTNSTVNANSRFFTSEKDVPSQAISMGIGRILRAKRILLLATGEKKAKILEESLFGNVTPSVPASILQFYQGELTVLGDKASFSEIIKKHPETVI